MINEFIENATRKSAFKFIKASNENIEKFLKWNKEKVESMCNGCPDNNYEIASIQKRYEMFVIITS